MAPRGRQLKAGEFVLLGSVVETKWCRWATWSRSKIEG
jgi:hypothetical protein